MNSNTVTGLISPADIVQTIVGDLRYEAFRYFGTLWLQ